jgi:hypothetical protein
VPWLWPFPPRSARPYPGEGERYHHRPFSIIPALWYVTLHAGISQRSPRRLAIAWPVRVSAQTLTRTGQLQ